VFAHLIFHLLFELGALLFPLVVEDGFNLLVLSSKMPFNVAG